MALRLPGSIAEVSAQALGGGLCQQRVRDQASSLSCSSTPPSSPSSPSSATCSPSSSSSSSSSSSLLLFNHVSGSSLHSPHKLRSQLTPSSTKVCYTCSMWPPLCEASGRLFAEGSPTSLSALVLPKHRFVAWPCGCEKPTRLPGSVKRSGHERVCMIRLSSSPSWRLTQRGYIEPCSLSLWRRTYSSSAGLEGDHGRGFSSEVTTKADSAVVGSAGKTSLHTLLPDNESQANRGNTQVNDESFHASQVLNQQGDEERSLGIVPDSVSREGWLGGNDEEDQNDDGEDENDGENEDGSWEDVGDEEEEEKLVDLEAAQRGGIPDQFVEIGVVVGTHGVKGELKVGSFTDFPKERFQRRGTRWIQVPSMSKEPPTAVTLLRGRPLTGKLPAYLITLDGVDSVEEASRLIGSKLLVRADQRPKLEEDEYYTPDLIGMDVVLQSSGEKIGEVVDVFQGPASELLRIRRTNVSGLVSSDVEKTDAERQGEKGRKRQDKHLIWIPFVKEIVPVVDMSNRVMEIDPPVGLLDLNMSVGESKKVRSEKKKLQYREKRQKRQKRSVLRKVFTSAGQEHVVQGLSEGTEEQRDALRDDLMTIDLQALRKAVAESLATREAMSKVEGGKDNAAGVSRAASHQPVCCIEPPPPYVKADWSQVGTWLEKLKHQDDGVQVLKNLIADDSERWWFSGLRLIAEGRGAVMVLAGGQGTRLGSDGPLSKGMLDIGLPNTRSLFELQARRIAKMQDLATQLRCSEGKDGVDNACVEIPWVVMTSSATDECTRKFFEDNHFFNLTRSQVLFMKQGSLPCMEVADDASHKILMETPWKVARSPDGNGSLFDKLHSEGVLDELERRGVQYVQVLSVDNALARVADPVFFGFCCEKGAEVGVKVVAKRHPEEAVGVVCIRHDAARTEDSDWKSESPADALTSPRDEGIVDAGAGNGVERERMASVGTQRPKEEVTAESQQIDTKHQEETSWGEGKKGGTAVRYYGVAEYSELPDDVRVATRSAFLSSNRGSSSAENRVVTESCNGHDLSTELAFQAAHTCINMFSTSFLRRVGGKGASLPYHAAIKRIPHVKKLGKEEHVQEAAREGTECETAPGWVTVSPATPNGLKMERFIFDAFKFAPVEKVFLLEVNRDEEFAPIKNASGPNVQDSPETARRLVMSAAETYRGTGWDLCC